MSSNTFTGVSAIGVCATGVYATIGGKVGFVTGAPSIPQMDDPVSPFGIQDTRGEKRSLTFDLRDPFKQHSKIPRSEFPGPGPNMSWLTEKGKPLSGISRRYPCLGTRRGFDAIECIGTLNAVNQDIISKRCAAENRRGESAGRPIEILGCRSCQAIIGDCLCGRL
jgi:hypothetical protein